MGYRGVTWDTPWDTPWDTMCDRIQCGIQRGIRGSSVRKKGLIYTGLFPDYVMFFYLYFSLQLFQSSNKNSLLHHEISGEDALDHCTANSTTISR